MPVWHEKTKPWVRQGKLVLLGITQEQHPDRCRLFAQWKQFDWPILHDPINVLRMTGVPVWVAIDEHGIVRSTRPKLETFEAEFLDRTFSPDATAPTTSPSKPEPPDPAALRRRAEQQGSGGAWRELGDALALWGGTPRVDEAIDAYRRAIAIAPDDGDALFRLGVCYLMRYECKQRQPNDFQAAVDHWSKARSIRPNQYIWRRRIEQYGPRLTKPYPFYDWVQTAVGQIEARGQRPVELAVTPSGAEIAHPSSRFDADLRNVEPPDPEGRIHRDEQGLIVTEVAVVPPQVKPGDSVRVHVTMRPNDRLKAHWNNEAQPLRIWIEPPPGWQVQQRLLVAPQGQKPETSEPRHLEFEVRTAADAQGTTTLTAYALYYVCEGVDGTCQFLRQDIPVAVRVHD